jgi:hypothetical protein
LEVRLTNMSAPFVWWVTRQSYKESTTHPSRGPGSVSQSLLLTFIHLTALRKNSAKFGLRLRSEAILSRLAKLAAGYRAPNTLSRR